MAVWTYPQIDPVFFAIGPFAVRWYGLAYVAGFVAAGLVMRALNKRWKAGLSDDDILDVVLVSVIALVVGARLGYVLFYGVGRYLADPISIVALWDGGMSFHGGLVGLFIGGALIARRKGIPLLTIADLAAVGSPLGIFFGRLANFINGELWGRESDVPWAMIFPNAPGGLPRHPSQLYEALLEGLVLFLILFVLSRKPRPAGFMIGMLLTLYGVFRIVLEFFREPDLQLGYLLGSTTMGQLLSLPMVIAGLWLIWRALRSQPRGSGD